MNFPVPKPSILRGEAFKIKPFLWFILFLITSLRVSAQMQMNGNLQLLPPYTAYLSDYANTSIEKMVLTLTSTNTEISSQRVKLKMLLEKGNSLIAYSTDAVIGEPMINLTANIPVRLTSSQLATYFRLDNLQGMSPDLYNRLLPEGMYRVTFEAYDYFSNAKMGAYSQQMWLVLNDPPQLNMPRNAENIQLTTAGSLINFQWIPRAIQSAGLTDYEFTLVEILDDYGNLTQQFLASPPKFQTTTQTTQFSLNPVNVPSGLVAGRTYAWRVRAKARQGITNVAMYKNDGYSDIFTFKYNGTCAKPTRLTLEAKAYDQINVSWAPSVAHTAYRVAYRKYSTTTNWEWVEQTTPNTFFNLTGLEPATEYTVKVGGICGPNLVSFTDSLRATTLAVNQVAGVNCGTPPTINIANQSLQSLLFINDVIYAGDFPVTLTQVTKNGGTFSGTGWVKVPWMADTKIKVSFAGITVNTDKKLIKGFIETAYDPNWGNILNVDQVFNPNFINEVTINVPIGSITLTNDNPPKVVIKDVNGNIIQTLPGNSNYTIKDSNGNEWSVSRNGTITKLAPKSGEPISSSKSGIAGLNTEQPIANDVPVINFEKHSSTKYGFDAQVANTAGSYEELPCSTCGTGKNYSVAYKSVATGDSDLVVARLLVNPKNVPIDSIKFRDGSGRIVYAVYQGSNTWQMGLRGTMNDKLESIYATVNITRNGVKKQEICGKINLLTYDKTVQKVILIPVNNQGLSLDATQVATQLNSNFKQAVLEYSVEKKTNFSTSAYNENTPMSLDHGKLWSYSPEQRALINAYEQSFGKPAANTLYLFLVNKAQSATGETVQGHTPLGKSYGFLFVGSTNFQMRTISHEVAHGASLGLEHTFDGVNKPAKTTTNNLLDYAAGMELTYQQWKDIHDFKLRFKIGQDVEDGQMAVVQNIAALESFKNTDGTYTFVTPAGKPISIPATNLKSIVFSTGDNWYRDKKAFSMIPFGTLVGFETNSDVCLAQRSAPNFSGYLCKKSNQYYSENNSSSLNTQSIGGLIGVPCYKDGFIDFAIGKVNTLPSFTALTANTGQGAEQRYDFLITQISDLYSGSDVKFLHAQLSAKDEYSLMDIPEVKNFLINYAQYANFGDISSLYVFSHVNQIAEFRDAYRFCELKETTFSQSNTSTTSSVVDNTRIVINGVFDTRRWLKESVIDWATKGKSRYNEVNDAITEMKLLQNYTTEAAIRGFLSNFKDNLCVWEGITAQGRINALSKILESAFVNETILLFNKREYYVAKILQTTPPEQRQTLLDALKANNFQLLKKLYDKVDGDNLEACFGTLTQWINESYKPTNLPTCDSEVFPTNRTEYTSLDMEKNCFPFNFNSITDAAWLDDGKIKFTLYKNIDNGSPYSSFVLKLFKNADPYSFVKVKLESDFDYSSKALGIEGKIKSGVYDVPLLWLYWFRHRKANDEAIRPAKALANLALTASVILSEGATTPLY